MKETAVSTDPGQIHVEGSAVGSALITGNGNVVTIVYAADVLRSTQSVGINPYRGLDAFDEASARLFFGRERLVASLLERLERLTNPSAAPVRLLAIMGPSGCGKSSVARAGLMAALAKAETPSLRGTQVVVLRPGYDPFEGLSDALARLATGNPNPTEMRRTFFSLIRQGITEGSHDGLSKIARTQLSNDAPLLLLVDQFEEIYGRSEALSSNPEARVRSKANRDAFVATLLRAATEEGLAVYIVITLRSDFYGALAEHPELSAVVAASHEIVPAMNRDDLRRAVAEPARVAGHPIDPGTVERILDQAAGEASTLPLVEFALERIWERLRDGISPADTLTALNGVGGALATHADEILDQQPDLAKKVAEQAFLACVQLSDAVARDTRRRAWLDEITPENVSIEESKKALEPFINGRLLAIGLSDDKRVWLELPHEALIKSWHTLRIWIEHQRDDMRFRARLQPTIDAWNLAGRPIGSLWRTPDLELLQRYASRAGNRLTALQREFLSKSERQRTYQKRIRFSAIAAIVLLACVSTGMWFWASSERQVAEQQRKTAEAERNKAQEEAKRADQNLAAANRAIEGVIIDLAWSLQKMEGVPPDTVRAILDQAEIAIGRVVSRSGSNREIRSAQAYMFWMFSNTYKKLGDKQRQIAYLRKTTDILRDPFADLNRLDRLLAPLMTLSYSSELKTRERLFLTCLELLADLLAREGDYIGALAAYSEAAEVARNYTILVPRDFSDILPGEIRSLIPRDREILRAQMSSLSGMGLMYAKLGNQAGALKAYQEAVVVARQLSRRPGKEVAKSKHELAKLLLSLGDVEDVIGDTAAAVAAYQESLDNLRAISSQAGDRTARQIEIALALRRLAKVGNDSHARWTESLAILNDLNARGLLPIAEQNWLRALSQL
ncbi:AAA ATPase domain-containing protein [Bradyrhizobium sp. Rc2d]|uniref:tetratricopeptide repeat protein n=1 Tax=Bradyrhizobium sp. Rc2d TaxID=1855321 RepID=UPI0008821904|nr:tetratricopeptide repeat protein [Bradyrhizobium sp. Rc2d]SDG45183.1 AAA ATPase domain-containing protein [Bradyrhizobium sp. Rc2d]